MIIQHQSENLNTQCFYLAKLWSVVAKIFYDDRSTENAITGSTLGAIGHIEKVFPPLGQKSTESSLQDSAIVTTSRRPQARVVESFFEHVFAQGSVKNKHNQSQKGFIIMTIILP